MSASQIFDSFIKSPHDRCNYRLITLPNSLQACLVSEPGLEKASAALDVHIGFFSDPKNVPGLAHFLEHLLFMGTEKYPKENEYSQFLSEHAGSSNAYTCEEHTNYFFDVAPEHLYGALDRFAQFFISPLFDPSGTEREMRAVDSENKKNLNNDHWRLNQLDKHLCNPEHPYSNFGTGNLETLNVEGIREVLLSFHERFYSANLMKLVVYGRESLDELQRWTEELFSGVKNNNVARPEWPGEPWTTEKGAGLVIRSKTLKEMLSMSVTWLIPDQRPHYRTKPEQYLTHLIGHEGQGSLFQALKTRGWLTSLSAGCDSDAHGYNFFQISIDLSPSGWENYEEILRWIVTYVSLLRSWGPNERIFEECRQLGEINFKFREKGDPSTFTHQLATWMQQYQADPRLILAGPFISEIFEGGCIAELLNHMTSDRMRVTLASSKPLESVQTEPWYGTEYHVEPISEPLRKSLQEIERSSGGTASSELCLPGENVFIPQSFRVPISPASKEPVKAAKLILQKGRLSLWHKLDDTFEQPKSQISIMFRTERLSASPLDAQKALLFKDLLRHCLILYDATLAGLSYDFLVLAEGFEIRINGFTDKLGILLKECLSATALNSIKFSPVDFEVIHDRQLRSLKNFPREAPYWHASFHLNGLLTEPSHTIESRIAALQAMQCEQILQDFSGAYFAREIGSRGNVIMLAHGSIEEAAALALAAELENFIQTDEEEVSDWRQRIVKFRASEEIIFVPPNSTGLDNPNCAVELFYPIGSLEDVKMRSLAALFVQIFNEPFFDTLRTVEQLGYLVTHGLREKGVLCGLRFLIQSERDPLHLDARIESFLNKNVTETLASMSLEDFETHKKALQQDLTQKKKTLAGESKHLWESIISGSNDFMRPWTDALKLDSISLQDLRDFHQSFLIGSLRTKLAVHIWSATALASRSINQIYSDERQLIVTKNRDELVKMRELYPSIYKLS